MPPRPAPLRHLRHRLRRSLGRPGTSTPEPSGLSASQALAVVETLGEDSAVGAGDLMEVAPPYDPTDATAKLAAYLVTTLLERQFAE